MYHRYFGMKHRPFAATPQVGTCYPAAMQEEALATLHYAITQGRGAAVLTGEPGTGKTLVCHRLMASLEPAFTTAIITNTNIPSVKALLQAILYDLSVPFHGLDEQELRLTLTDFLLGKYAGGGRTVLVIDEAHNLAAPLFEELRMLSNLEGEADKLFQIVLAGQPRLLPLLRSRELESMNQRVGARAALTALDDEECIAYIQHQLQCAGVRWDDVFTYEALCTVYEATEGIPRRINQLCDLALLQAYVSEARRVDQAIVQQAHIDLYDGEVECANESTPNPMAGAEKQPSAAGESYSANFASPGAASDNTTFVASTEYEGTLPSFEIIANELMEEPANFDGSAMPAAYRSSAIDSGLGDYVEEEIVIDRYARMDAARSAPLHPVRTAESRMRPAQPSRTPVAPQPAQIPEPFNIVRFEESPGVADSTPGVAAKSADATFLEAWDNPAVHEVGAGIAQRSDEHEPPILVIESRPQRIGSHIARIDGPQRPGQEPRGYRRLFTHARKS